MRLTRFVYSLILLLVLTFFARAETPVVHISHRPDWLNTYHDYSKGIPNRDVENGYFFQLIEEQVEVEKKADYTHIIRQIVSDAGIQNGSQISISFDPSYQKLDVHDVIVWRDGKPQNRLSPRSFKVIADEKELYKFIYHGTYSAYYILDDIRKGDKIEYSFTITGRNPIMDDHYCADFYLQESQPVAHIYTSVIASPQRVLYFKSFNKVPKTIVNNKNGRKCYVWEDFQVKPSRDYDDQPGWFTNYGHIQVSDFANWHDVALWALKINQVPEATAGGLGKQINLFKQQAGNDKEKYFRLAVKFVQDEIRYMGIELGQYSHKANSPARVFDQRYGDCKDKSMLLATILKAGGIPANMVLINTEAKGKTDQYLPSAYDFDHATVVAKLNGKQVWVDATISYQGGTGTNIYYPNYGKGLILAQETVDLATIAPAKAGSTNCTEFYVVPKDKGDVSLDVTTTYTLNEADDIRGRLASSGMSETERNYLNYYRKIYPKITQRDSITVKDNEQKNEITTVEHYMVPAFFKTDSASGRLQGSFYANFISERLIDIDNRMAYPRQLAFPFSMNYTISVVLPVGWNIDDDQNTIKRDEFNFVSNTSAKGDTLNLNYRLTNLVDFVAINKQDQYRDDVKKLKDNELGYTFYYSPGKTDTPARINYWMLAGVIFFALLMAGIGVKIYRTHTAEIVFEQGAGFTPIGGWLIVLAVGLAISVFVVFSGLVSGTYFDLNKWNAHLNTRSQNSFRILFVSEALGNTLLFCYTLFCFILFINKRDILPKFMIGLYLFTICFYTADYLFAKTIYKTLDDTKIGTAIIRSIIIAVVWIPYFKYSARVQQTFIVPYPAHNFSYEEMPTGEQQEEESN